MDVNDKNELNINLEEFLPISSRTKSIIVTANNITTPTVIPFSSCTLCDSHSHNITFLDLNGDLGDETEKNKREFNDQPLMGSSRWNPTPEQLLALEEMYRRGTRTPTAEQIQQIASQLRRFGKIEGKNVFYWFQNHKARERQKRRREIESNCKTRKHDHAAGSLDKKVSGLRMTGHELEQKKILLVPPPNYSDQHREGPFSMHRRATAESKTIHGWSYFEERELNQHKSGSLEKNSTWHASSSSRFINDDPKNNNVEEEVETLELFPLTNRECGNGKKEVEENVPIRGISAKLYPNQYFEFLPLMKN